MEEGKAIGIEQGETKKAREIALNLISNGLSNDIIARATGVSIEDIEKMR